MTTLEYYIQELDKILTDKNKSQLKKQNDLYKIFVKICEDIDNFSSPSLQVALTKVIMIQTSLSYDKGHEAGYAEGYNVGYNDAKADYCDSSINIIKMKNN